MSEQSDVAEQTQRIVWVEPLTGAEVLCDSFEDWFDKASVFVQERDALQRDGKSIVAATRSAIRPLALIRFFDAPAPTPVPVQRPRERRARRTARTCDSRGDPSEPPPRRGVSVERLVANARLIFEDLSVVRMRVWLDELVDRGLLERLPDGTVAPATAAAGWWRDVGHGINGLVGEREEAA